MSKSYPNKLFLGIKGGELSPVGSKGVKRAQRKTGARTLHFTGTNIQKKKHYRHSQVNKAIACPGVRTKG